VGGVSYIKGTTSASGQSTISGPSYIAGQSSVSGSSAVTGPSYISGQSSVSGKSSISGSGVASGPSSIQNGNVSAAAPRSSQSSPQAISGKTAQQVLPYAAMSSDAYGNTNFAANYNFQRVIDSATVFSNKSNSVGSITSQVTDFHADVFANQNTKQLVVAFRGTNPADVRDWLTNGDARVGVVPDAYKLAAQFARGVQQTTAAGGQFHGYSIVLTGHSLGGAEASYAGSVTGLSSVTFEAARNRASEMNNGTAQINVIVPADAVGANGNSVASTVPSFAFGAGSLNGKTYAVNETQTGFAVHDAAGLYQALSAIAQ
jgi:hypothetical protein